MFNIIRAYSNSSRLTTIIGQAEANLSPDADIDALLAALLTIDTAQSFALDIWGRIVGVNRQIAEAPGATYFGFDALPGFDQAPFGE